jgi:uncharacterized protein (DUF1330 family)
VENEDSMTRAYLIVEMDITDRAQYKQYVAAAPASVKAFGGEYLVRGGKHKTLEDDWTSHRLAVLRFRSYDKAKAFYDDAHYKQVREKRVGATEHFNMVLVEGVAAPV